MSARRPDGQGGMVVAIGALVGAAVVGLLPFVPALAQQIAWLVAIVIAAGWAVWDWRRRAADKRERAERHRRTAAQRDARPPSQRD